MKFIKEAIAYYKNLKIEEKQRKRLLNTKLDYGALQLMIDNAENIVNNYEYRSNITITCHPNEEGCYPLITVETEFLPEKFVERF